MAAKKGTTGRKKSVLRDPEGGLTQAGRDYFNRTTGSHLQPGITGATDTPAKMRRKGSFLRRHYGGRAAQLPLTDKNGDTSRQALQAHAWGEPVPKTAADVKRLGELGTQLLEQYSSSKSGVKSGSVKVSRSSSASGSGSASMEKSVKKATKKKR